MVGAFLLVLGYPSASLGTSLQAAAQAYAEGKYKEALAQLPPARKLSPEGQLLRARVLIHVGKFHEARWILRGLFPKLPHLRDLIRFLQGEALLGAKAYLPAAQIFRAAGRYKRSRWVDRSWRRRAYALMSARQYRAAAREYQHILRIYPDHPSRPDLEYALAICLKRSGQRRKAAVAFRELWMRWPLSKSADLASKELKRLMTGRSRVQPPSLGRRLRRIRKLRRGKRYKQAIAELKELASRPRLSSRQVGRIQRSLARTLLKSGDPASALAVMQGLYTTHKTRSVRIQLAECLARHGKVDEAAKLLLHGGTTTVGRRLKLANLGRAAFLLAEYGRYGKALELYDKLIARTPSLEHSSLSTLTRRMTWLAYRAGKYERAIKGFQTLIDKARRKRRSHRLPKLLYWQARAHARAGHTKQAEALYQQIVEKYLRNYYGLQARSRLMEAGKVKLPTVPCSPKAPTVAGAGDAKMLEMLTKLITRHGDLYPSLHRVRTLWRLGMIEEARRELRLIAIDYAWVRARGRPRRVIVRPPAERVWRDSVVPRRRSFGRRERKIFKECKGINVALGAILKRAGIFHFAQRFLPRVGDLVRRRYPRGYAAEVLAAAKRFDLDPNLIWAVIKTESTFRTDAISRASATGLMQIMPNTGRRIAADMKLEGFEHTQLFDPRTNVTMAAWYLNALSKKFKGQLMLIAAAYNGGPHNVALWIDQRGRGADLDEFIEEIPFDESRRYAKKILRLVALYERVYCGKDDRTATTTMDPAYGDHPAY